MRRQLTYVDFDLLIGRATPDSYWARVVRSPIGASAPGQFTLPFSRLELENFVLKLGRGHRTRGPGRTENAPLKDLRQAVSRGIPIAKELPVGVK